MRAFVLAMALAVPLELAAQPAPRTFSPVARAEDAGFSTTRLSRIDQLINGLVNDGTIPGAVVFVSRNGRIVMHKAYGYRDLDTKAPLQKDDIFRIASQSKAITSLAVMLLWEEGRFGLDDPISSYIPEFKDAKILKTFNKTDSTFTAEPAKNQVTIRQLLTHSSGIDYAGIGNEEFRAIYAKAGLKSGIGNAGDAICNKMRVLGALPLKHEPGAEFTYSLGLDVLGCLIEVISGMPFDRFLKTRIFDPLGMKDTWFYLPADRASRLVTLHTGVNGKSVVQKEPVYDGANPDYPKMPGTYFSGGAGLSSTAEDYARFLQLFLNKGEFNGARLLSPTTVDMMMTDQLPKLDFEMGLAFGLETPANDYQSPQGLGSFAWGGAFSTTYWADPTVGLIGQIYTNLYQNPAGDLSSKFGNLVYAALVR